MVVLPNYMWCIGKNRSSLRNMKLMFSSATWTTGICIVWFSYSFSISLWRCVTSQSSLLNIHEQYCLSWGMWLAAAMQCQAFKSQAVADPGFPVGGGMDLVGGAVDPQGGYISKILHVKMKESGPVGGHAPPRSANAKVKAAHESLELHPNFIIPLIWYFYQFYYKGTL